MRWLPRVALGLFAVLLLLLAPACRSQRRRAIRITATPWVGNTPLLSAQEKKLFGDLDVRVVELSTDFDSWRAIVEGRADATTGTVFDTLRAIDHGADLRIVMALDFSTGADGIIGREGIEDIRALKGRAVAVEKSTLTHFVLLRAIERAGMREEDVTLRNLATDEAMKALDDGRVDAAALWEPLLSQARKPGRKVLFTSAEIPGEIMDVLAVRSDVLRDRPEDIDNVMRGFHATVDGFMADQKMAAETVSRFMDLDVAESEKALERVKLVELSENVALFDRGTVGKSIWGSYNLATAFMQAHGMLRHPVKRAEDVIDGTFLARAAAHR